MGIVHAIQKGDAKASDYSKEIKVAAKGMKKKDVKDFAKTDRTGLPNKVKTESSVKMNIKQQIALKNFYKDAKKVYSRNAEKFGMMDTGKDPMYDKLVRLGLMKLKSGRDTDGKYFNYSLTKTGVLVAKKILRETAERDYKDEYKKFQSSDKSKKYRAELNKYNRQKGTYGNNDGKDASHKGGKIVGFESQSKNRGRAEKSRLKKEQKLIEGLTPKAIKLWKELSSVMRGWKDERKKVLKLGSVSDLHWRFYMKPVDLKDEDKLIKKQIGKVLPKIMRISKKYGVPLKDIRSSRIGYGDPGAPIVGLVIPLHNAPGLTEQSRLKKEGKLLEGKIVRWEIPKKDKKKVQTIVKKLRLKDTKDYAIYGSGRTFEMELDAKYADKVLDLLKKMNVKVTEGKLKKEAISKDEWAQYPKYARKLKPYMKKLLKVPVRVRVIKQANHNPWIEVRVARFGKDIIPNDFRKKALKAIGGGRPRDMDNITYGNITAGSISMKHDQWVKLLGNKVKSESINEAGGVVTARIQQKPRGYWAVFNKRGQSQFEGNKKFMINILKKASTLSPNAIGSILDRARFGDKHLEFKAQFSRYYFNESVDEAVKDPKLKVGQKIRHKNDPRKVYTLKKITHGNRGIPEDPAGTSYMFVASGNRKEYHTKKTWAQAIKKGWIIPESINEGKLDRIASQLIKDLDKEFPIGKYNPKKVSDFNKLVKHLKSKMSKLSNVNIGHLATDYHNYRQGQTDKERRPAIKGLVKTLKRIGMKESINEAKTINVEPNWEGMWRFFKRMAKTNPRDWKRMERTLGSDWKKIDKMAQQKGWKSESVNESTKRQYRDVYSKYYKTYEAFAREVMNLTKRISKISGDKVDAKIILKNFKKHVIPFAGLMNSWSKGRESNPHIDEGFGSTELMGKKDLAEFEKTRQKNAEVLGYKLTGQTDIKPIKEKSKVTK